MVFILSALFWIRIRDLWNLPDERDSLWGKLGRAMLSKSWIPFSVDGQGYVPSLLFDLRLNYCGNNEDNGDLLQKVSCTHCHTQCPNSEAGHICHRLLDTHGQVWVSLLLDHCSFFLGPYAHKFLFLPSKSLFPQSCVSSGSSVLGLMVTSSKRAHAIPRSAAPRALPLQQATADPPMPPQETPKHRSKSPWGLWVLVHTRYVWALWAFLVCMGFDFKSDFAPPTILLGLFICPCTWGISSESLQHRTTAVPVPTILLGLLCPWTWAHIR